MWFGAEIIFSKGITETDEHFATSTKYQITFGGSYHKRSL